MINPCKGCVDRHEGCHGRCEEYQEWLVMKREANNKQRLESKVRSAEEDRWQRIKRNRYGK